MPETQPLPALPHPFPAAAWPKRFAPAVRALWAWHGHLWQVAEAVEPASVFLDDVSRVERGEMVHVVPGDVTQAVYEACAEHDLPRTLLAEQMRAAAGLVRPVRFETHAELLGFIQRMAGAHSRLLAHLADLTGSWQQRPVQELTQAFFLTGRLARLPQDLAHDWLFIPLEDLADAGVTVEALRAGALDDAMRRLLWKQTVRARDAYAQGRALINDLPRRQHRTFKLWWLGGLDVLNEIERRKYDVWAKPIRLTPMHRFRIQLQALIGKAGAG